MCLYSRHTHRTKEARTELLSLVISAHEAGRSSSVRKRAGAATTGRRGSLGSRGGGSREMAMDRDPVGEVRYNWGGGGGCKGYTGLRVDEDLG